MSSKTNSALKHRVNNSNNVSKEKVPEEKKRRKHGGVSDLCVHATQESLLTSTSGFENYRGILNLCLILLSLSNFRVALDNILNISAFAVALSFIFAVNNCFCHGTCLPPKGYIVLYMVTIFSFGMFVSLPARDRNICYWEQSARYGVLIDPVKIMAVFLADPYRWPSACLVVCSNIFIQFTFFIENCLVQGKLSERIGSALQMANLFCLLSIAPAVVLLQDPPPWASFGALFIYVTIFMKLFSYVAYNYELRLHYKLKIPTKQELERRDVANGGASGAENTVQLVRYPENLTQSDLYYFLLAPTVCYELNFPRTKKVRKRFLFRRAAECLMLVAVIIALTQQWIVPTVVNSLKPYQEMDFLRAGERIMKLAIPNHLLWLLGFYAFFHSWLNLLAEILRFGDRKFYEDWWNAPTISYFWKNWNIPVHRWALRHIFRPLLRAGYSKTTAIVVVFIVSAFFHEYLVSVPLHMAKCWAFLAMLVQVPLAIVSEKVNKYCHHSMGNVLVWLSLILGQPLAILMYYHDYLLQSLQEAS